MVLQESRFVIIDVVLLRDMTVPVPCNAHPILAVRNNGVLCFENATHQDTVTMRGHLHCGPAWPSGLR
jgi:hypothetical protein